MRVCCLQNNFGARINFMPVVRLYRADRPQHQHIPLDSHSMSSLSSSSYTHRNTWSEMNDNLCRLVFSYFDSLDSFASLHSVCKHWSTQSRHRHAHQHLFIVFPTCFATWAQYAANPKHYIDVPSAHASHMCNYICTLKRHYSVCDVCACAV